MYVDSDGKRRWNIIHTFWTIRKSSLRNPYCYAVRYFYNHDVRDVWPNTVQYPVYFEEFFYIIDFENKFSDPAFFKCMESSYKLYKFASYTETDTRKWAKCPLNLGHHPFFLWKWIFQTIFRKIDAKCHSKPFLFNFYQKMTLRKL